MKDKKGFRNSYFRGAGFVALETAIALVFVALLVMPGQTQTYQLIYTFDTTSPNPWDPAAGVSIDAAGNLYGTTIRGGGRGDCPPPGGCGAVFELKPSGSGWVETLLHGFNGPYDNGRTYASGASDGAYPYSRAILGPDGAVYGTVLNGATRDAGAVYQLTPSGSGWTETVLHRFTGGVDGGSAYGDVTFDTAGNLYGTTVGGGYHEGTVFKLTHSGAGWTKSILYSFQGGDDGSWPYTGVIFDGLGNIYGTTSAGDVQECSPNCGTVYELSPSGSGWTEKILYNFHNGNDGGAPSGVVLDSWGNLFGTICGGPTGGGAVFMLAPSAGNWSFHVLYRFTATECGFLGSLTLDEAGNIYGTTKGGGAYDRGTIFKLTRSGGSWWHTDLYDFTGGTDGGEPNSSLLFDRSGNLYGTTQYGGRAGPCGGGGRGGCGVVFEITP